MRMRKIYDFILKMAAIVSILACVLLLDALVLGNMHWLLAGSLLVAAAGISLYLMRACLRRERAAARRVRRAAARTTQPALRVVSTGQGPHGPWAA